MLFKIQDICYLHWLFVMQLSVYLCINITMHLKLFMVYIYFKNFAVPQIPGWKKAAVLKVMWLGIPVLRNHLFVKGKLSENVNCSGLQGPAAEFCRMG